MPPSSYAAVSELAIVTDKEPDGLDLIRHSTAHLLAYAVKELFPDAQVTIGPVIENGFYYDFHRAEPFTPEDLPVIEKKMREIIARDAKITREVWSRDDAKTWFIAKGETFKGELIDSIKSDEPLSIYKQGQWLDLCRGPHLPSVGKIGTAFKLMKVAGAQVPSTMVSANAFRFPLASRPEPTAVQRCSLAQEMSA